MPMDQIKQTLFQFLDRQLSIKDFEQWVYATPALEQLIPPASYVELIALNYAHKFTYDRIEKLVMPLIDEGGYQLWKLQSRLRIFIDGLILITLI